MMKKTWMNKVKNKKKDKIFLNFFSIYGSGKEPLSKKQRKALKKGS